MRKSRLKLNTKWNKNKKTFRSVIILFIIINCLFFLPSCEKSEIDPDNFEELDAVLRQEAGDAIKELIPGDDYFFVYALIFDSFNRGGNYVYYLKFSVMWDCSDDFADRAVKAYKAIDYEAYLALAVNDDTIDLIGVSYRVIGGNKWSENVIDNTYTELETFEKSRTRKETVSELYETYFSDYIKEQYNALKSAVETSDLELGKELAEWFAMTGVTFEDSDELCEMVTGEIDSQ